MSSPDQLRIGDAEREQAQSALADHYAAGRLDHDEYSQRLDRIWAARTRAELDPVFVDLPTAGGVGPTRPAAYPFSTPTARSPQQPGRIRSARPPLPLVVLLVVLGLVAVVTHLPLILVGLGVWFFFLRGGGCHGRADHSRR